MQSIDTIVTAITKKRYKTYGSQIAFADRDWAYILILMCTITTVGTWYIFISIIPTSGHTNNHDVLAEAFYDSSLVTGAVSRIEQGQEYFVDNFVPVANSSFLIPPAQTIENNLE
jgi:hypothetical protein